VLAALAAGVVGVAAAAAVLAARDRAPVAVSRNSVAVIDPARHRVVASAAVGGKPFGIAVGADGVWVGNRGDSTVLSLDARTAHVVGTVGLSPPPSDVALYAGMAWVVSDFGGALWRFNPRAPELRIAARKVGSYRGAVPEVSHGLVFGAGSAWAVDGPDAIARTDPATGKRLDRLDLHGRFPDDIAFGEGSLWVLSQLGRVLTEVDPRTDRIAATVHVGEKPAAVAVGAGAVWVSDLESNTVCRVNPDLDLVEQTIPVGNGPTGLAVGQGRVWVANSYESTVSEIDPARNAVVKTIHVGYLPSRIALGAGMVWVTVV
jgi:YVTN family beta-propeller protein